MSTRRLRVYEIQTALDRAESRLLEAGRPQEPFHDAATGGPPYRLFWGRIVAGAPGDPPDERYYAEEVLPGPVGENGHVEWEAVPGGLEHFTLHNVAEADAGTHLLPEGTVVRVEERLDRSSPPVLVRLTHQPVAPAPVRLARVLSYDQGTYTVQPVRREPGGIIDEGDPIEAVPNLGELWNEESGYLAGPEDFDVYVPLLWTPAGWTIVLHPPRMV